MNKNMLLKLHRWITLIFALPLAVVVITGLVLSVEPMIATGPGPVAVTADGLAAVLARHDPGNQARTLFIRAYAGNVSLGGAHRGAMTHVDLATNSRIDDPGALAGLFSTSRRLHEALILDQRWLVTASTAAMLVLIGLGFAMGWPRIRNNLSGWHKGTAWLFLPLVVLSPLTGLLMALGVTFAGAPAVATSAPMLPMVEAVRIVAADHDLSTVSWIRPRGDALLARLDDDGEMRVFTVTRDGLVATPRNWPRLIHEGNWGGALSVLINVVTSLALIVLMGSGLWLWARRRMRPRMARTLRTAQS
ncbi:PepSY-associated TM helix domain-containing protein [Xanthobacteraceae bacterium Astr-EGSB]|uniref:PepSY domain-containing protein n=1 Tax=Astrobacterium formosum TaxID=3069710 RepID=UPI0027B84BD4|nr:PepSY-associated TM helix domain-containing protein [Xanthobacteraceae bacterium Astr-EGSB]